MVVENVRVCSGPTNLDANGIGDASCRQNKTRQAKKQAVWIAEQLTAADGQAGVGEDLSEQTLFLALQTCACQAAGGRRRKATPREQQCSWAKRWKVIRDYILKRNLGLVYVTIARFGPQRSDWEDLRSEALFALMRAIESFDPRRGFRFSTYACTAITRSLIQAARRTAKRHLRFLDYLGTWQQRVERIDACSELCVDRLGRALELNSARLTDRESMVLAWRFPRDGPRKLTLAEVGNTLGVSKERVRCIQNRGLAKLRQVLQADPVLQDTDNEPRMD